MGYQAQKPQGGFINATSYKDSFLADKQNTKKEELMKPIDQGAKVKDTKFMAKSIYHSDFLTNIDMMSG